MSICDNCKHNMMGVCTIYGYYIVHSGGTCDDYKEVKDEDKL